MHNRELIFLHVSDIHFHRNTRVGLATVDDDLRRQLLNDAAAFCRTHPIAGILVTGDIAFSGTAEQYEATRQWLAELCQRVGCDPQAVWMVPGNHDVVRTVVEASKPLRDSHANLRRIKPEAAPEAIDRELEEYLTNDDTKHLFLKPLANYVAFAGEYGCQISVAQVYWEKDLPLADGVILRLRGLTTPLISDKYDDKDTAKLVLGRFQVTCPAERGVVYLTLAHHPPSWLLDEDEIDDYLKERAAIQLFGHKHRQRVDAGDNYLRLTAGATNPEESERGWKPCYNYLAVSVVRDEPLLQLRVRVFPRVWHDQGKEFRAEAQRDGREFLVWSRQIDQMKSPASLRPAEILALKDAPAPKENDEVARLAKRFAALPFKTQQLIARQLGLQHDGDIRLSRETLFATYYERAVNAGQLIALRQRIEQA